MDLCTTKNVRVNHKIMGVYMEVQPLVVQRRIEEMNKLNAALPQPDAVSAVAEPPVLAVETESVTNLGDLGSLVQPAAELGEQTVSEQ